MLFHDRLFSNFLHNVFAFKLHKNSTRITWYLADATILIKVMLEVEPTSAYELRKDTGRISVNGCGGNGST
jgi:hypothetical protein